MERYLWSGYARNETENGSPSLFPQDPMEDKRNIVSIPWGLIDKFLA
jgi:hypothetical protein